MTSGDPEQQLARREQELAAIPATPTGLDPGSEERFRKARRRLGRHHRGWRAGMPTLDTLFDDDAHRARALAGSLCTELEDLLITWGRLRSEKGAPDDDAARFVDETAERWQHQAGAFAAPMGWDGEAGDVFRACVADLVDRARTRGHTALRGDVGPVADPPGRAMLLLRRIVRPPMLALRRFFRPAP